MNTLKICKTSFNIPSKYPCLKAKIIVSVDISCSAWAFFGQCIHGAPQYLNILRTTSTTLLELSTIIYQTLSNPLTFFKITSFCQKQVALTIKPKKFGVYLGVYIPVTNIHPQICNAINMPKATRSSSIYTSPNIPHYILHNVKYAEIRALY